MGRAGQAGLLQEGDLVKLTHPTSKTSHLHRIERRPHLRAGSRPPGGIRADGDLTFVPFDLQAFTEVTLDPEVWPPGAELDAAPAEESLQHFQHPGDSLWTEGVRLFHAQDTAKALEQFCRSIAVSAPACPPAWTAPQRNASLARRLFYVAQQCLGETAECVTAALDTAQLGGCLEGQEEPFLQKAPPRLRLAVGLLRRAIALDVHFLQAYLDLALLYSDLKGFDAARSVGKLAQAEHMLQDAYQRPAVFFPQLKSRAFWSVDELDPGSQAWIGQLEREGFPLIRSELVALLKQDKSTKRRAFRSVGGHHRAGGRQDWQVLEKGDWREVVLFEEGPTVSHAAEVHFPRTIAFLRALIPEHVHMAETGFGEIIISRLAGGSHIAPHCAPNNARLTVHLGLDVPRQVAGAECAIRVGSEWRGWATGRCLVFDDSFEHEVVNSHPEHSRTVLLIRFWHPGIVSEAGRERFLSRVASKQDLFGAAYYEEEEPLFIVEGTAGEETEMMRKVRGMTVQDYLSEDDLKFNRANYLRTLPPCGNPKVDAETFNFSMQAGPWEDCAEKCRMCGKDRTQLCAPAMVLDASRNRWKAVYECCGEEVA